MNNALKSIITFSIGAAAGAVVSWRILESKYRKMTQEEIAEIRDLYSEKMKDLKKSVDTDDRAEESNIEVDVIETEDEPEDDYDKYVDIVNNAKYKEEDSDVGNKKPYIITREEFEEGVYAASTFTYYADGVLADEFDREVLNAKNKVGTDFIRTIEEEDYDEVYVRNDRLQHDYEIVADPMNFSDLHLLEGN